MSIFARTALGLLRFRTTTVEAHRLHWNHFLTTQQLGTGRWQRTSGQALGRVTGFVVTAL